MNYHTIQSMVKDGPSVWKCNAKTYTDEAFYINRLYFKCSKPQFDELYAGNPASSWDESQLGFVWQ